MERNHSSFSLYFMLAFVFFSNAIIACAPARFTDTPYYQKVREIRNTKGHCEAAEFMDRNPLQRGDEYYKDWRSTSIRMDDRCERDKARAQEEEEQRAAEIVKSKAEAEMAAVMAREKDCIEKRLSSMSKSQRDAALHAYFSDLQEYESEISSRSTRQQINFDLFVEKCGQGLLLDSHSSMQKDLFFLFLYYKYGLTQKFFDINGSYCTKDGFRVFVLDRYRSYDDDHSESCALLERMYLNGHVSDEVIERLEHLRDCQLYFFGRFRSIIDKHGW